MVSDARSLFTCRKAYRHGPSGATSRGIGARRMAWFESVAKSCQPWKPFSNAMSIAGPRGRSPPPLAKGLARGPWSNWPLSLQTWMPGVKGLVGENSPPTVACPLTTTEWAVPTWNGYLLSVACPCGVTSCDGSRDLERWAPRAESKTERTAPVPEFWNERGPSGTSRVEARPARGGHGPPGRRAIGPTSRIRTWEPPSGRPSSLLAGRSCSSAA
jgi:hypothetical protein